MRRVLAAGIVNLVLTVAPASPAIRARHECLIAFDGVAAGAGSQRVFCRDGDPRCDVDGVVDGHCTFDVRLCVNVRGVAGCRPRRLKDLTIHLRDRPKISSDVDDVLTPPPLQGHRTTCGALARMAVPINVRRSTRRVRIKPVTREIRVTVRVRGRRAHDTDVLRLQCLPSLEGYCFGPPGGPAGLHLAIVDPPADVPPTLDLCLTGCDGTSTPACMAAVGRIAGVSPFAPPRPPQPQLLGGVPVCVVEQGVASRIVANIATGAIDGTITKRSMLHLTEDPQHICPRCVPNPVPGPTSTNACDIGMNANEPCAVADVVTVAGQEYPVSYSCLPAGSSTVLATNVLLTTGSSMGCGVSDAVDGLAGTAVIPLPAWPEPTYPKFASGAAIALSVCRPATGNAVIDAAVGRPTATSARHALDSEWLGPDLPGP